MSKPAVPRACYVGALTALPILLHAQTEPTLPTIVVEGKKADTQQTSTSKTTRIDAQQIQEQHAKNIKDMVRYEPGVSVTNNASRFGMSGFNIRGLEGNRILMQVDGVRLGDQFVMGGYSNASRDAIDIELLDSVDIERGSGSAQYGSDALGGSVSYTTPSPESVLQGRPWAGTLKATYQSVDRSWVTVVTGAAAAERIKLLVRAATRRAHETETQGDVEGAGIHRTKANPQATDTNATLFKVSVTAAPGMRSELAYQASQRSVRTQVLSQLVGGLAKDMNARDAYAHEQVSISQGMKTNGGSGIDIKLYGQRGQTDQYTKQDRNTTSSAFSAQTYERLFAFQQDVRGVRVDGVSKLLDDMPHLLTWGLDGSVTDTSQLRDGFTTLKNGTVLREVTVDTFPTRDTPLNATRKWALYAQDEWLMSDTFSLLLAGRYERHKLVPETDPIYLTNEAAQSPTSATFKNFSPKVGGIWSFDAGYTLSGQYSRGFRAPPYNDVNIGFANMQAGYTAVANPDLRPERSQGLEWVWQRQANAGKWAISFFDNRYRDFIESQMLDCPSDPVCSSLVPLTFQARNVSRVRIYGGELKVAWRLADDLVFKGALAYARGRKLDEGKPLDSVNPLTGTVGFSHDIGAVRYELAATFARGKSERDAEKQTGSDRPRRQFLPGGYAVADFRLNWRYAKDSSVGVSVNNLFDRVYYHWADVPVADIHVPDSQAGALRYSQPGRHLALSILHAF